MTNPYTESATDDVLYPDDLEDRKLQITSEQPLDAGDVDHEDAKYGQFSKALDEDGTEVWVSSPKALREFIGQHYDEVIRNETPIEVTLVEKPPGENEPYVIEARLVKNGDPL
jgi:hypothetical protein